MNSSSQIQRIANQLANERAQVEKLLAPSQELARALRSLELPQRRIVNDFAAAMQKHKALHAEFLRIPAAMEDIRRQVAASRTLIDNVVTPFAGLRESIRQQAAVLENLTKPLASVAQLKLTIPQISRSAFAWECAASGLTNRMHAVGLFVQRQELASRLLAAPKAYTEFLQRTTDLLAKAPSDKVASALRGSLNMAESQLLDISGTLSGFIVLPEDNDESVAARPLRAPFAQQEELLARERIEDEEDIHHLLSISDTAETVELSREVLHLVTLCNEASRTSIGNDIFKPTTRLLEVFAEMPWVVATDRKQIADIVDCLYFIFYEGAGKDQLRFMARHGGPLDDSDCDLIWCIKHLRNKWTRHDVDHGRERAIQKSWNDLAAKFRWLKLSTHPTEDAHFRLLQQRLLVESKAFLKLILDRLALRQ